MLHYHGTPITPREVLYQLAGRNFCVSFAHPADVDVCLSIGQSVMFDNGAFSHWRRGLEPDWTGYKKWLQDRLRPPHWAVIPDVIGGTENENRKLVDSWPYAPANSAPVWHMHESIGWLMQLCRDWPRVCIGSSGDYAVVGTERWAARLNEAFNYIPPKTWVHMLRAMDEAIHGPWPFASADSTNAAQNHSRDGFGKIARIDAAQPRTRRKFATQMDLIA